MTETSGWKFAEASNLFCHIVHPRQQLGHFIENFKVLCHTVPVELYYLLDAIFIPFPCLAMDLTSLTCIVHKPTRICQPAIFA